METKSSIYLLWQYLITRLACYSIHSLPEIERVITSDSSHGMAQNSHAVIF